MDSKKYHDIIKAIIDVCQDNGFEVISACKEEMSFMLSRAETGKIIIELKEAQEDENGNKGKR